MAKKERKPMLPKERTKLVDELDTLKKIRNYTSYRLPEDFKLKGVERAAELVLADDSRMDDVVLLDFETVDRDITKVLEKHKVVLSKSRVEAVTGLESKEIKELLTRGIKMETIETLSVKLQDKADAELEPQVLMEGIIEEATKQGEIEPLPEDEFDMETLDDSDLEVTTLPGMEMIPMESRDLSEIEDLTGISVTENENGDLEVTSLEEVMEITPDKSSFEKSFIEGLEKELSELVAKYKAVGDVGDLEAQLRSDLDKKLEGTEIVMNEDEKGELVLSAISKKEREEKEEAEEKEKKEIAEALGEDPDNVISIIRLKSKQSASEMTNDNLRQTNSYVVVRLKNNNFKMLKEVDKGTDVKEMSVSTPDGEKTYVEEMGYEINPLMKELAPAMKDTAHSGYTDVLAGETKAGKTNPNSNRYNVVQIVRAGESKTDNQDFITYIGLNGERVTDVVTNHGTGLDFDRDGVEITYPKDLYIQGKEYDVHDKDTAEYERETGTSVDEKQPESGESSPSLEAAIQKRIMLLEKLLELEEYIKDEENDRTPDPTIVVGAMLGGDSVKEGMEYSEESRQARLDEAYDERAQLLKELGYKEDELTIAKEEAERAEEAVKSFGPSGAAWN